MANSTTPPDEPKQPTPSGGTPLYPEPKYGPLGSNPSGSYTTPRTYGRKPEGDSLGRIIVIGAIVVAIAGLFIVWMAASLRGNARL